MRSFALAAFAALFGMAPAVAQNAPVRTGRSIEAADVRTYGAKCDAQVLRNYATITAGSGGTRDLVIGLGSFTSADVGKLFVASIGGASAAVGWNGTIASVTDSEHITVTAPPGTALTDFTHGTFQWGHDDHAAIASALAASNDVLLPGQCGNIDTILLNRTGMKFGGMIGPPGHTDLDGTPAFSSALVWLGSCGGGTQLRQTSISGASNKQVKGQYLHDLTFYNGACANYGRVITTVANSKAERLYSREAKAAEFAYGIDAPATLGEVASTCVISEADFVADAGYTDSVGFFLSGVFNPDDPDNGATNWNTCNGDFRNFQGFFRGGDGVVLAYADHNLFTNMQLIGSGASTTAYSIHFSGLDSAHYAQANGFFRLGVGNVATNTQGRIKVEDVAQKNWVEWLDTFDPPVGWAPVVGSGTFTCTTDGGTAC